MSAEAFSNYAATNDPLTPSELNSSTLTLTTSATAQQVAFDSPTSDRTLSIYNDGTAPVWCRFQPTSTTTAVAAVFPTVGTPQPGFPVPATTIRSVRIPDGVMTISGISKTGSANVFFSPGRGGTTP